MNRSKPMRRTPMPKPAKPLQRVELNRGTKGLQRSGLRRGVPLRLVSTSRQAENRVRAKAVRELRANGDRCARCGRSGVETAGHERLARAHGGDITQPDMLLCHPCNTFAEDEPRLAAWQGWKVSRKWPTAPCITAGACRYGAHELDDWCGVAERIGAAPQVQQHRTGPLRTPHRLGIRSTQ